MDRGTDGIFGWITGSVRNKIMVAFTVGIGIVAAGALYGLYSARTQLGVIKQVNETQLAQEVASLRTQALFKGQVQEWKDTLLRGRDPKLFEKYWGAFEDKERNVAAEAAKLAREVDDPNAKALLEKFATAHIEMGRKYRAGLEEFKKAGFEPSAGDIPVRGMDREPTTFLDEAAKAIQERSSQSIAQAQRTAEASIAQTVTILGVVIAAALALVAMLIGKMVVRPIVEAASVAEVLARGDLTQNVEARSNDEAGRLMQALRVTVGQLAGIVRRIKETSDLVTTASREIAQGNSDLSTRTEQQASALEETSASMQQMTATVSQNAQNAKKANDLAADASSVAAKGGKVVREAVGTMNDITEASKKIADIIGVIDGIAFQTNILALNAAVEAARAGDQGRGFAVVASEVRSLAQRSAAAAKEIKDLITDSVSKVDAGSRQVNDAGRTMEEVVDSVRKVTSLIGEITAASQEQAQGIEQVSETMTQLERVTQQNAAMVEEASAAAGSLEEQSRALSSAIAAFRLTEDAGALAPAPAPKPAAPHAPVHAPAAHTTAHVAPKKPAAGKRPARQAAPSVAEAHPPHPVAIPKGKGNGHAESWQEF